MIFWSAGCGPLYPVEEPSELDTEVQTDDGKTFVPRRRLLPPPFPPVLKPGVSYLNKMGASIQRGWADYLESVRVSLPPNDPLNDYVLETKVEIVLNQKGELEDTKILSSSGEKKYDQAAKLVVKNAAPFDRPSHYRLSDDGLLHVTWLFARDRRQAGVAGANYQSVQIPAGILVRKLALEGRPGRAAQTLARESSSVKNADSLLQLISVVSLEQAALSGKFEVSNHSIETLAALGVTRSLPTLRKIAFSSAWTSSQAIKGLAELEDVESKGELKSVLKRSSDIDKVYVLSETLTHLGEQAYLAEVAKNGLISSSDTEKAKALRVLAFVAKADDKAAVFSIFSESQSKEIKTAAAMALGGLLPVDAESEKLLSSCLTSTQDELRLACYRGLHLGVKKGYRSPQLFSHVLLGTHDLLPEIRRLSYYIAAMSDPEKFAKEVQTDHEKHDENLLVVVNQLALLKNEYATKRLLEYAKSDVTRVRGRAIRGLIDRDTDTVRSTIFQGLQDENENVRVEALAATDQYFVPGDFNHSPSVKVKAVALQRWMTEEEDNDLVSEFSGFIAQSKDVNERAFWASLWLSKSRHKAE